MVSSGGDSSSSPKPAPAITLSEIYPFDKGCQLDKSLDNIATTGIEDVHLPGYPRIALSDTVRLTSFLRSEFCNDDLDKMSPHLWIMSTQSSANISPLHRQKVKGRE